MMALHHEIIEKMQNHHEKELMEAQENFNIDSYYDFLFFFYAVILILAIECPINHV